MPKYLIAISKCGGVEHRIVEADSIADAARTEPAPVAIVETPMDSLGAYAHLLAAAWVAPPGCIVGLVDVVARVAKAVATLPPSVTARRTIYDGLPGVTVSSQEKADDHRAERDPYVLSGWYRATEPTDNDRYQRLMRRSLPREWNNYIDSMSFTYALARPTGSIGWMPAMPRVETNISDALDAALDAHNERHLAWKQDNATKETE